MSKITIHAGDFLKGDSSFSWGNLFLKTKNNKCPGELIELYRLEEVALASEESIKKMGGAIGWGCVGAVLLGPLGFVAGALVGGRKKEVTFIAKLKDGRKLFATTDNKTFIKLQAATF